MAARRRGNGAKSPSRRKGGEGSQEDLPLPDTASRRTTRRRTRRGDAASRRPSPSLRPTRSVASDAVRSFPDDGEPQSRRKVHWADILLYTQRSNRRRDEYDSALALSTCTRHRARIWLVTFMHY